MKGLERLDESYAECKRNRNFKSQVLRDLFGFSLFIDANQIHWPHAMLQRVAMALLASGDCSGIRCRESAVGGGRNDY